MTTRATKTKAPTRNRRTAFISGEDSNWELQRLPGLQILKSPAMSRFPWLVQGFSTRPGGLSQLRRPGRRGSREPVLNLGITDWDSRQHVIENRRRFAEALGANEMRMVTLRQIHSDIVQVVESHHAPQRRLPGDALVTREPGLLLAVQTADCVPILLADTRTHAVAAIHAGWRGTLKRIAEKALGRMRMQFGTRPEDVLAALGPAIGGCCYEVGHEVAKEFAAQFADARDWFAGPWEAIAGEDQDPNWLPWLTMMPPGHAPEAPRVHLNLLAANCSILRAAGVPPRNIAVSGFCTACRTDLFFSYRRERDTGRLMAAIGIL